MGKWREEKLFGVNIGVKARFFDIKVPENIEFPGTFLWCGQRDLNPYPLLDTPLKRARMPIPPRPQNKSDYKSRERICQALTKDENTDSLNPVFDRK